MARTNREFQDQVLEGLTELRTTVKEMSKKHEDYFKIKNEVILPVAGDVAWMKKILGAVSVSLLGIVSKLLYDSWGGKP